MSRRRFLQTSLLAGAGVATGVFEGGARALAQGKAPAIGRPPFRILMGGYGPPNTSFSLALKQIGEALKGIDLTKAATDPQALAKLQKITAGIDQTKLTEASQQIEAWAQKNCKA